MSKPSPSAEIAAPVLPDLPDRTALDIWFTTNTGETLLTVSVRSAGYDGVAVDTAMLSKYKNAAAHLRTRAETGKGSFWLPNTLTALRIAAGTRGEVAPETWIPLQRYASALRAKTRSARRK